jgi:hypothetical protein
LSLAIDRKRDLCRYVYGLSASHHRFLTGLTTRSHTYTQTESRFSQPESVTTISKRGQGDRTGEETDPVPTLTCKKEHPRASLSRFPRSEAKMGAEAEVVRSHASRRPNHGILYLDFERCSGSGALVLWMYESSTSDTLAL